MKKIVSKITIVTIITLFALSTVPVGAYVITVPIFEDGFESGDMTLWTSTVEYDVNCHVTVQGDPVKDGSYSMSSTVDAPNRWAMARKDIDETSALVVRFWLRFDTVSSDNWQKQYFLALRKPDNAIVARAFIEHQPSGDLWRVEVLGSDLGSSYVTINKDQWYYIELTLIMGANGSIILDVDDVNRVSETSLNFGTDKIVRVDVGDRNSLYASTKYYDSVFIGELQEFAGYKLSTYTEGKGTVLVSPAGPYDTDDVVTLTAVPNTGWSFAGWEDDLAGSENPETVTMTRDKVVTAIFTDTVPVTVSTSAPKYDYGETMVVQIREGTGGGDVMIQINLGTAVKWTDQRTVDSSGSLDYYLKIPSVWSTGTFTVRVKDIEGGTTASTSYTVPKTVLPPTPPSGGGGGGGGGVVLPTTTLIASLPPEEAAALLEDLGSTNIAGLLSSVTNNQLVADILEIFDPELTIEVLKKMTKLKAIGYLRLMSDESVLDLVLGFDEADKDLLQLLVDDDFERAAGLVEEAIKTKAEGLTDEERKEALEELASAVSTLDKQKLIDLLIYIAKLPETPTTIAYMLESMSLSTVLDVVSTWLMDPLYLDARPDLIAVLQDVSTSLLGDVYIGITNAERLVLYPYLSAEQVAELPEIGEFEASRLVASPMVVEPDEQVTVTYTITNTGDKADRYMAPLKVNGVTVETDSGLLDSGASVDVTHSLARSQSGTYTVEVLGKTANFQVLDVQPPPKPADLKAVNIEVVPSTAIRGETVSVFVTVRNDGELQGTASFTLKVNAVDAGSKQATLAAGDSMTLLYEILADYTPGTHQITVGDFTATLTVQERPQQFPWLTIITTIVVLVAIGVYLYMRRSQQL